MAEVTDNPSRHRFELVENGQLAISSYRIAGDTIAFLHVEVPPAIEGRGIGSRLAKAGLDEARARGLKVASYCPFVTAYLKRHPEYSDLLG